MTKRSQRRKAELYGVDSSGRALGGLAAPANTTLPTQIGPGKVANLQTCNPGVWTGAQARVSYQWRINGTPVTGSTGVGYTPQASDATKTLTCQVAAANPAGSSSVITAGVVVVP
jgi:hypothetical protein